VQLEAASFAKLWEVCRAEGLSVVADVHTHPAGPRPEPI
jgi:proteasome lid subunit RPN8/RPN11